MEKQRKEHAKAKPKSEDYFFGRIAITDGIAKDEFLNSDIPKNNNWQNKNNPDPYLTELLFFVKCYVIFFLYNFYL